MLHFYRILTGCFLLFFCYGQAFSTPAVTPSCSAGETHQSGLNLTTYDTSAYNSYPNNHTQYDTLISNYAIPANEFGSGIVSYINGSGNPYGSDDNYLSVFTGYIEAPSTGIYGIGVDGDDAIEVIIDGVTITGWYGGHGSTGSAQYTVNVSLDAGYHTLEFRHQERSGGDNYYLYWQKPGDSSFSIVPTGNLSSCQTPLVLKPAVSPTCVSPNAQLQLSTYNTAGYYSYPSNHADYNNLVSNYAIAANLFGSGTVSSINGSGNPYGSNTDYLSVFTGYINAPEDGQYLLGVDGDDAVEVIIDGEVVTGWYGGHGSLGSAQYISAVNLATGYHDIEFRHQERSGGDNYYLYWQRPSDSSMSIVSGTYLYHCPYDANISLAKTSATISDPFNLTTNPKAIPGAVVEYTLTAVNSGSAPADNNVISDTLDVLITTQQAVSWVSGSITLQTPSLYSGVKTTLTDLSDSDEGQFIDTAGNRVLSVNCGTLATGQSCVVSYRVTIN